MKTHFLIAILALVVSACASRENRPTTNLDNQNMDQYSRIDGQASRIR